MPAAAPILNPEFPVSPHAFPAGPPPPRPISGRDLYRQAVHDYLNGLNEVQRAAEPLARRKPTEWDRAIDVKWRVLPSIVRRRWEAESRRIWPPAEDRPSNQVTGEQVFCNSDETYYVRRRERKHRGRKRGQQWDWDDEYIRDRYRQVYNTLPPASNQFIHATGTRYAQRRWEAEADKINHARGFQPVSARLRDLPATQGPPDNGSSSLMPSNAEARDDVRGIPVRLDSPLGHGWQWHKTLGRGGMGVAMLYRHIDNAQDPLTHTRIVVKRDSNPGSGDQERRVYQAIHAAKRTGYSCTHIIDFYGGYSPLYYDQGQHFHGLSRTYLSYAPLGDLSGLFNYYRLHNILLPEPFMWYLLRSLASATRDIERNIPGVKPSMFNCDLKAENVLLDMPDESLDARYWHSHYPTPRTADLGLVEFYPPPGGPEPMDYRGAGTTGYRPFELLELEDQQLCNKYRTAKGQPPYRPDDIPEAKEALQIDENLRIHTTIYQIGMIMWLGMTLTDRPPAQWEQPTPPDGPLTNRQLRQLDEDRYRAARRDHPPRHRQDPCRPIPANDDGDFLRNGPVPADAANANLDPAQDAWAARRFVDPRHGTRPHYGPRLVECVYRCLDTDVAVRPSPLRLLYEADDVCYGFERAWPGPRRGSTAFTAAVAQAGAGTGAMPARPRGVVLPVDKYPVAGAVLNNVWTP